MYKANSSNGSMKNINLLRMVIMNWISLIQSCVLLSDLEILKNEI